MRNKRVIGQDSGRAEEEEIRIDLGIICRISQEKMG